jgi:hypothetical protein
MELGQAARLMGHASDKPRNPELAITGYIAQHAEVKAEEKLEPGYMQVGHSDPKYIAP